MITKENFTNELYKKIVKAMQSCDRDNSIDMRLYTNSKHVCEGIYSIRDVDALYEEIKKHKEWFIDFYENIKDANTAEFMDIALFSGDFGEDNGAMSVEEFDAKWGDDVDRYALSEEKEREFVEDAFNMYETGGFSPTFHSPFTLGADMNGVAFQVIGRATTDECDLEQLPMWKIEFEDGTRHYAFPCEITKIERKNQDLAQNLQKEDVKPIKEENTMNNDIKIIVDTFDKEFGERTFNEILGCAKSNIDGLLLVRDVDDFNNNEIACEVEYKGLNFKVELVNGGVITEVQITPKQKWGMARENAICLWNTLNDSCFVEITPKYVKFFKSENGHFFACYEYPPLASLKKDMTFINEVSECMAESNMLTEQMQADLKAWRINDCDLPPFPISVILHSEYQNYKFTEWE